jgi:hypothetical protein
MKRRKFLALAAAAVSFPSVTLAQAQTKRLAFLNSVAESDPAIPIFVARMKQGVASQGWVARPRLRPDWLENSSI